MSAVIASSNAAAVMTSLLPDTVTTRSRSRRLTWENPKSGSRRATCSRGTGAPSATAILSDKRRESCVRSSSPVRKTTGIDKVVQPGSQ